MKPSLFIGKTIGIVDKDVTVIDLEKRPDKDKIIKELEQLTGEKCNVYCLTQWFINVHDNSN